MVELLNGLFYLGGNLVILMLVIVPIVFLAGICLLYFVSDMIRTRGRKRGIY